MACPDYYQLAAWDGREFWEFFRDECSPLVADALNDGEKHALQSACEHLFRRDLKAGDDGDLNKFRWWLNNLLHGHQSDDCELTAAEHADAIERAIMPVLALVELRRKQKLGEWAALAPSSMVATNTWGPVESLDDAS